MLAWIKDPNGEYKDLRFRGAVFFVRTNSVVFTFSSPEPLAKPLVDKLEGMLKKEEFYGLNFRLKFVADSQDRDSISKELADFLKENYYAVYAKFKDGGYFVNKTKEGGFHIVFKVDEETDKLFSQMELSEALMKHFAEFTVTPVSVATQVENTSVGFEEAVREIEKKQQLIEINILSQPSRKIKISNIKAVVGKKIKSAPQFISDVNEEGVSVVICGKIKSVKIDTPKTEGKSYNYILKMKIEDITGTMSVVHYSKLEMPDSLNVFAEGDEVAVFGKTVIYGKGSFQEMQVMASNISRCEIDQSSTEVVKRTLPDSYLCVIPQPYEKITQSGMFDEIPEVPQILKERDVVVFDLETTGLRPDGDKIIEIGAVKIKNGSICEYFETLVNPECHIPEDATRVNNITDDMVADAPKIIHVMGDFYKFCHGCVVVSHNITFDYGFLQYAAKSIGFDFDNELWDTLEMSKKFFAVSRKGLPSPKDFKLKTLAAVFGVEQLEAHRAFDDARVAAEVLINMLQRGAKTH